MTLGLRKSAWLIASWAAGLAAAQQFDFAAPSDDRWQYPFNFSGGSRATGSVFSSLGTGTPAFNNFNDRDGIILMAWNTAALITPGQGVAAYDVAAVVVTLTAEPGGVWPIDLTVDEWFTCDFGNDGAINADGVPRGQPGDGDGESSDADPGRPLELFGMGFGPTYTAASWTQNSPYIGGTNVAHAQRDPYPMTFDAGGAAIHVEDSVQVGQHTPAPWALGVPAGYTPGNQSIPFDVTFTIDLSLAGGGVRDYFGQQLDAGRVCLALTSLTDTIQGGTQGGFPSFYQIEGVALHPLAKAASLSIVLGAGQDGDVDGNGCVNLTDLAILLSNFGSGAGQSRENGDLDGDADVDLTDLAVLLANYGSGDCG